MGTGKPDDTRIRDRIGSVLALSTPFRGRLTAAALLLVLASLASLVLPTLTGRFIDCLVSDSATLTVAEIAVMMVAVMIAQGLLSMSGAWILAWTDERVLLDIRTRAFEHLLKLPISVFQDHRKGELVSRIGGDVEVVGSAGPQNLVAIVQRVVAIIGVTVMMWLVSPKLLFLCGVGLPLFLPLLYLFGKASYKLSRSAQDVEATLCGEISDTVQHASLIRSFNAEDRTRTSYQESLKNAYGLAMKHNIMLMLYRPATAMISFCATLVVLFAGGELVRDGVILTGDLVAFIMYVGILVGSLSMLVSCVISLMGAAGAAGRVFDLLDLPQADDCGTAFEFERGEISVEDLSFAYEVDHTLVLNGLNLVVAPGETVAVTGPSGSGKSTLLKLLCGLHTPGNGTIRVDGQDLSQVSIGSIRRHIAYLEQESQLIYGSVRDNLRYGNPEADEAELMEVARQAQAHEFIQTLPDGYDTVLGEDGVKLSTGQRHRLCLARTLLKDAPILLLDEPGAALDRATEESLVESLREAIKGRTCIIVAHNPAIAAVADRSVDLTIP